MFVLHIPNLDSPAQNRAGTPPKNRDQEYEHFLQEGAAGGSHGAGYGRRSRIQQQRQCGASPVLGRNPLQL